MSEAQERDSDVEWREVEGQDYKVPFDLKTDRPYNEFIIGHDGNVQSSFSAAITRECAYADCSGKDHEVVVDYGYDDLDSCPECGADHMGYVTERKKEKSKEESQKKRRRRRRRQENLKNSINVSLPDVDVPQMVESFDDAGGGFWMVDPDKTKVPEDDLGQWKDRLEEVEEAALMLAKAAQELQQVHSPEDGYRRFEQFKKAWNKTTYQTRRIAEGVSVNTDYALDPVE